MGTLFNDILGLSLGRSRQEARENLEQAHDDLIQIANQARNILEERANLSLRLGFARDLAGFELDRPGLRPYLDNINHWYTRGYSRLCEQAAIGQVDLAGIDDLVSVLLDNETGVEVSLFSLNALIVGDQVEGALSSTVKTLLARQGGSDPLTVYRFYQTWFLSLVWIQVLGLVLLVDALNYLGAHPERQSAQTKRAAQLTWPGSVLEYCQEVFIPKLQHQVQVYLGCVEKFAASVAKSSRAPHDLPPLSIDDVFFQVDLLAQQAGGFAFEEGKPPPLRHALVVHEPRTGVDWAACPGNPERGKRPPASGRPVTGVDSTSLD